MAEPANISSSQIEALLSEADLRQYFRFDHPEKRGVLGVAFAEGVTGKRDFNLP